ncbi:MAG: peptidyl-tRNA hydrolase Pth2 [Methermicoccaceae archaeon]
MEYKQCLVIRADLKMGKGKLAAQAAHAAIAAFERSSKKTRDAWLLQGQKKVVVRAESEQELMELYELAVRMGLPCALVHDAGLTQLPPNTLTALGIGPAQAEHIDRLTGNMRLL